VIEHPSIKMKKTKRYKKKKMSVLHVDEQLFNDIEHYVSIVKQGNSTEEDNIYIKIVYEGFDKHNVRQNGVFYGQASAVPMNEKAFVVTNSGTLFLYNKSQNNIIITDNKSDPIIIWNISSIIVTRKL